MTLQDRLAAVIRAAERAVLLTVLDGPDIGAKLLVLASGERYGDAAPGLSEHAARLLDGGQTRLVELDGRKVFVEIFGPPPRLLVIGAIDTAEALCAGAHLLGWRSVVADARATFVTRERLPSADELIVAWPTEAIEQVAPDRQTAIVILTHDEKFDLPAIATALATSAFYVGALGSRHYQATRRERLLEAGLVDEAALERLWGPCGLDIAAESQAETAVSILAEIVAERSGRRGGRLRDGAHRRIHGDDDEPQELARSG